jgi:hypothetical protein
MFISTLALDHRNELNSHNNFSTPWRIQNSFLLRSPLYDVDNCPRYTVKNAREKHSGYAIVMWDEKR